MGQVIRLPVRPPADPDRSAELDPAECVLLIAVRWWVADHRLGVDPLPRLCQALDIAGAHDAAFSVDRLMAVVARSVRQSIVIQCPRCPRMSDDEKSLLHAASLAQAGDAQGAEMALHTALLSAQEPNSHSARWKASANCLPWHGCSSAGDHHRYPAMSYRGSSSRGFPPNHPEQSTEALKGVHMRWYGIFRPAL
jgi:hypothetical protein